MKQLEFNKIKRYIYKNIKNSTCKIIYTKRNNGSYYDYKNRTCVINAACSSSYIEILYEILHEICHDLTFKPEWDYGINGYFVINNKWRPYVRDRYMVEYKAEKLLRKLCCQNQWNSLLRESNKKIKYIARKHIFEGRDWNGYYYMATRIIREEQL